MFQLQFFNVFLTYFDSSLQKINIVFCKTILINQLLLRFGSVPGAGIEPALAFSANRILSPACLPIPPPGLKIKNHPLEMVF